MKKWYSLIDKIYRKENLELAFKKVKRNNGAPGIDGETVLDFEKEIEMNIEFLHGKLKTNTYEPSPVRRVEIEARRRSTITRCTNRKGQSSTTSHCKHNRTNL